MNKLITKNMSNDMIHSYVSNTLLSVTMGSWGAYEVFKSISDVCRDVLPITGILSFLIYLLVNYKKIKEAWKNYSTGKNK